jgi:uncharacterized protein (TIGR02302 family)
MPGDVQASALPDRPMTRAADPLVSRIQLARAVLTWESAWPAMWPTVAVLGGFLVLAAFDILPVLPAWLHALILVAFVASLGWTVWQARNRFAVPPPLAGQRRLEVASGFTHRPLFALRDELVAGADDPMARALWQAHRDRIKAALKAVRVGWPAPGLPTRDPLALRAALVLLLIVGATAAGTDLGARVQRALVPGSGSPGIPPGALDLWITPPTYTGLPPILPQANQTGEIAVPAGSVLLAQVTGGRRAPHLLIDNKRSDFTASDATGQSSWRLDTKLESGSKLAIEQGSTSLGSWKIKVIPDTPPTAEFPAAPARSRRAALKLDYSATDDYGLNAVVATIRRADGVKDAPGEPIDLPLTLPSVNPKDAKGSSYHDLTAHPWAGLQVNVQLRATDALGQTGTSEQFATVLPERVFQHPVARAIVEQRKALVTDPSARAFVGMALAAIAGVPAQYYDDSVVYLALTMAAARLKNDETPKGADAVQALLWDTALRVEEGTMSLAEREMRDLQQRLQDALANNAPDEEIEKLIRELQEAINRYLQAMMENAMRNPQQMQPMDRNAMRLEMRDLQRMLDQARQLARTGARDAARDLLAKLQDMLENLKAGQPMMGQQPGGSEGQQMMQGLQDLIQKQQSLLDRTFRRSQQGRPGQRGMPGQQGQMQPGQGQGQGQGEGDGDPSGEQEALRRQLGEMMRQLGDMMGDIPGAFGRAERSMRDSGEALGEGAPGRALRPQMDALDQLRSAARDLAQQMADRFGPGDGDPDENADGVEQAQNRDPAGRPLNGLGGLDGRDVTIPEASDVQRSREILDELLRRAGERFRPNLEREYIDRLLKRF